MSVIVRGIKNTSRNVIRTSAITLILAIAIGLALAMLLANEAVANRITALKEGMGTRLTISPAGAFRFQGGGEPLTNEDADKAAGVAHIEHVDRFVNFMLENDEQAERNKQQNGLNIISGGGPTTATTSLVSAVDAGSIGKQNFKVNDDEVFTLPITGLGISSNTNIAGKEFTLTAGRVLTSTDGNAAVIGKDLAAKNNLAVGSTFSAFDETFTVVGIFDLGTKFDNNQVAIPIATAQRLTSQENQIGMMVAKVDSIDNLETATTAIKDALGNDRVDVSTPEHGIQATINSLKAVQNISMLAFIGTLVAAAVITFMIMFVIVRERRREIGVLKAIGGSNWTIVRQFIVEAMVILLCGGILGTGLAFLSSGTIANALVTSNTTQAVTDPAPGGMRSGSSGGSIVSKGVRNNFADPQELIGTVTTSVGWMTVLIGILSALGIAVIGTAIPAWFIAKIRPAEVLRGE